MSNFQFDLSKRVVLNLAKEAGIEGQMAKVAVCMDFSGSMTTLYNSGYVQKVVERLIPIAMAFDDNQSIDFYRFDNRAEKLTDVNLSNYSGYVQREVMTRQMGYTNYSPALKLILDDFLKDTTNITKRGVQAGSSGFLGMGKKNDTEISTCRMPVYVIFITDGDCGDKAETERFVRDAAGHGMFIQFVGITNRYSERFAFLEKLDDLSGRFLDNVDFFDIPDSMLTTATDQDFYAKLLNEYPGWVKQAKTKGVIA